MLKEFFQIQASSAFGVLWFEITHDNQKLYSLRTTDPSSKTSPKTLSDLGTSVAAALQDYFETRDSKILQKTPRAKLGTTFQNQVWKQCSKIPYGQVKSYSDLALRLGNPKAVRAVAQALGANPWLLMIPCHRVIAKSGAISGYSARGGVPLKKRLLRYEESGIRDQA